MIGFVSFDEPIPVPTTQELLALLTAQQKIGILDSFAERISPMTVKHLYNIRTDVVKFFYGKISDIQDYATKLMKGQLEAGIVDEIMTYVDVPTTLQDFVTIVSTAFENDFSVAQTTAVINKMIAYSKSDGTGDWAWYSSKITA